MLLILKTKCHLKLGLSTQYFGIGQCWGRKGKPNTNQLFTAKSTTNTRPIRYLKVKLFTCLKVYVIQLCKFAGCWYVHVFR